MLLSVDVAHAMHPNQNQKADVTNQPVLNRGFCIKESGNQSYATDCEVVAIVEQICKRKGLLIRNMQTVPILQEEVRLEPLQEA